MTEASALVDSNVIIDIIGKDPKWMRWSVEALNSCESAWINPLIFGELCYLETSPEKVEDLLIRLDLGYLELPKDALFLAAQAYRIYRQRGGTKTAPLPDFFIGAHAAALGVPIITRDVIYRLDFEAVTIRPFVRDEFAAAKRHQWIRRIAGRGKEAPGDEGDERGVNCG